jgi:bifunctional UDP-N-acetylglucosamine pyrophosphorylase/glucosamine-1-phosphate N-acetyltransferase
LRVVEQYSVYLHGDSREVSGINTRAELAEFENLIRRSAIRKLMIEDGVTFIDPSHAYISAEAQIGRDTIIYPNVTVEGKTIIGERCVILSGARITNSRLGNNVVVKDHSNRASIHCSNRTARWVRLHTCA